MTVDLRLGDCLEILPTLPAGSVDAVITDPPYSTPVVTAIGRQKVKNFGDLSIQETYIRVFKKELERVMKPAAPIFLFCDDDYYPSIFRAFYDWQCSQLVVWDKGKIGMGTPFRKRHELIFYANRETLDYNRTDGITHYPTVLQYRPVEGKERLHRAQKPVELIEDLIKGFTSEGDMVLDCYMGSGTTVVAAHRQGRRAIGCEINPEYYEIAQKRIQEAQQQMVMPL